jgi:hypothetical protein
LVLPASRIISLLNGADAAFASRVDALLVRLAFGIPSKLVPLAQQAGAALARGDYLSLSQSSLGTFDTIATIRAK